ncbi:asparaginase [Bacillus coahuilensis p1.1.43]|uniref:asparaginase n=2 Tax=Bacillus coahuilensis TaxID=408580 RepID=A0A147K8R6_9BACI|nr:asparaginase [Bacillus coahuilensis]KUP06599.1 asparaginase [Bacillus coahuilensis p1.1.43]
MKKHLLIIHTGGTISMYEDMDTGSVMIGNENQLSKNAKISDLANFTTFELFHVPSPHMTPEKMHIIHTLILSEMEKNSIDGVVITHGTDTLEETAYFLDTTLDISIPIVVTGAMRSSNEIGSDGLYNFITSIRVATCDQARNKGVLVVLNDEIHSALNVTKTHTSNVATFQSPQHGPIGLVTKKEIIFHHSPNKSIVIKDYHLNHKVALLKAYTGMDSDLILCLKELQYDGVVIEGLGQGNLPPSAIQGIQSLRESQIPIVLVSRCFNGIVQDVYDYEGGGKRLKEEGVIFCNGLNGQKARIKLLLALSVSSEIRYLHEAFQ